MVVVQTVTISDPGQSRGCDGVAPSVRRNSQLLKRWWSFDSQDLDSRQLEGTPQNLQVCVFREFGGNRQNFPGVATNRRLLPEGEGISDGFSKVSRINTGWKGLTLQQGLDTNDSWVFGLIGRWQAFFKSFASWNAPCSREAASPGKLHESASERWSTVSLMKWSCWAIGKRWDHCGKT